MSGRPCELRKLQAHWDPRTPIPQHQDALPRIIAALQPHADAAKATDYAIDQAKGTTTEKVFATLRARAAMAGVELYTAQEPDGRLVYVGIKWAESTSFANLAEVVAWLDRIDGGRP